MLKKWADPSGDRGNEIDAKTLCLVYIYVLVCVYFVFHALDYLMVYVSHFLNYNHYNKLHLGPLQSTSLFSSASMSALLQPSCLSKSLELFFPQNYPIYWQIIKTQIIWIRASAKRHKCMKMKKKKRISPKVYNRYCSSSS